MILSPGYLQGEATAAIELGSHLDSEPSHVVGVSRKGLWSDRAAATDPEPGNSGSSSDKEAGGSDEEAKAIRRQHCRSGQPVNGRSAAPLPASQTQVADQLAISDTTDDALSTLLQKVLPIRTWVLSIYGPVCSLTSIAN